MAIKASTLGGSSSGTPFGDTSGRPLSPSVGQTYYNGELGYQEIYTNAGWIPSSGGNDFNLNITGTHTAVTFSQSYSSGSYSIVSTNNDTTIDIYAYAGDGTLAGYTANKSFSPTQRFNKMIIIGGTSGDVLTFTYKPTFSTSSTTSETTGPAWITSVSTSSLPNQNNTTNITGGNFASNVTVTFTGTDSVERSAKAIVVNSTSSLTVTRPDNLPITASPFTVKVVNPSVANLPTATNAHILSNAITAGSGPAWSTAATLPNYTQDVSYSTTLVATDADAGSALTYSLVSGTLPTGLSLASSTGVISGTPTVAGSSTFTVRATDSGGNYVDRAFTTTQVIPNPPSITSAVDVGTNRPYNNGAASVAFSNAAYTGTTSITSYTVTASTGQTASGASSPITVTGIVTGATPTFTVTATNAGGTSLSSVTSASVTITTVPAAPTIGTVTRTNSTTVSIPFTTGATGGKTITSYTTVSNPSISLTTTGTSTPLSVTGSFTGGTSYTFTIAAINANGTSTASSSSNSVIPGIATVTGGTLTSDATYYYRTFTSSGTLSTDLSITADALIVAGGGGAGGRSSVRYASGTAGGGGGAGGARQISSFSIPSGSHTITIGSGGGGGSSGGSSGSTSSLGSLYSNVGGGAGAQVGANTGGTGGSGGGGGYDGFYKGPAAGSGGAGTSGQGNNGASGTGFGGAGGGAGSAGSGSTAGTSITVWGNTVAAGGSGGNAASAAGTANTGNGGGTPSSNGAAGGSGGSGLVVIRYLRSVVGG